MADKKISALDPATIPLAGTEVLPIVQSGTTDNVSVANLTAGRAVAVGSLASSGNITENKNTAALPTPVTGTIVQINGADATGCILGMDGYGAGGAPQVILRHPQGTGAIPSASTSGVNLCNFGAGGYGATTFINGYRGALNFAATETWTDTNNGCQAAIFVTPTGSGTPYIHTTFQGSGDLSLTTGNLVQGTAAKGVNFTANTPAAGMTSQLLNWYEEGTFTPTLSGATTTTYTTQIGRYTRVGRLVSFQCEIEINSIGNGNTTVALLGSLPTAAVFSTASVGFFTSLANSIVFITGFIGAAGGNSVQFQSLTAAGTSSGASAIFQNGARIIFSGQYSV